MNSSSISTAYIIGMSIGGVLTFLCLVFTAIMIYKWIRRGDDDYLFFVIFGLISFLLTIGITVAITWPPFDMKYHTYVSKGGTITAIAGRQLSDGKASSVNYAVQFGSNETYRCDDTRCALLVKGDKLYLNCIRDWEFNGVDGWVCKFVNMEKKEQ